MKKKLGILVHPGWSTLGRDDNMDHIQEYVKAFDRFDTVMIYVPKVEFRLRIRIFKSFIAEIIDYYLYGIEDETMFRAMRKEGIKLVFDLICDRLKVSKQIKDPTLRKHAIKIRLLKLIHKGILDPILEKNLAATLFEGDQSFLDDYAKQDELFKSLGDNVVIMEFGSIALVNRLSRCVYNKLEEVGKSEITLFGEYYNQCVKSHGMLLDELKLNYTIDKSLSVYNTADYIKHDDELNLEDFKHTNKTMKEHQK